MKMGKPLGVLMFLLVILKVLGTAEACSSTCSPSCFCQRQGFTSVPQNLPTTITELDLGTNDITTLSPSDLSQYVNLVELWLNTNGITDLPSDIFTGLGNLQILYLFDNDISDIKAGTFDSTPQLRILDLGVNRLTSLTSDMFSGLPGNLERLSLDQNEMTTLPSVAYDVLSSISTVDIRSNPWQCDCKMVEFRLKMTGSYPFENQITCSQPDNLSGRNLIDVNPEDLMTDCQKPKIARFERIGNHPLVKGETLRLVCEAFGIPTPEITVTPPSGVELNATEEVTVWPTGTVVVRVTVAADDSGQYVCIAANFNGSTLANFSADVISPKFSPSFSLPTLISNSAGSTLAYSTDVVYFETSPTFSLPILILYLIGAVAGTLVVVAIVLAIWCKCCRKDHSVAIGPDTGVVVLNTGPPAVMYSGHGARVAWGHPMAMSRV